MTKQEIFDRVVEHLARQKRPATFEGNNGLCAYRGTAGTKCAFGIFIPDEFYTASFENRSAHVLITHPASVTKDEKAQAYLASLAPFLSLFVRLQEVHDQATRFKQSLCDVWAEDLELVSTAYDLKFDREAFVTQFNSKD